MASIISNEKYSLYTQKIRLLYKRPEIRASVEIILSIFTIIILVMAAIRPTLVNITTLQKKIADQEVIIKKADNKISQLINAQKQLTAFSSNLQLFDNAVPDGFSYADSAKRIEYMALLHNLNLDTVSFSGIGINEGTAKNSDWIEKVEKPSATNIVLDKVNFTVNGKPNNVILFLKDIEGIDRLVQIDSISLSKQIGQFATDDTLKATGQLAFYFYYLK